MGMLGMHSTEKVYQPCEITEKSNGNFKSNVAQFYMAFIECFFVVTTGMLCTMPTIVVGALHNKEGDSMSLNDTSASWIGSILLICHPCGALSSGLVSDKLGRKGAMRLLNIPFFASWLLYYFATSVEGLVFATVFMGYSMGLCEAPIASYISEAAQPRLRGVFNSAICAFCGLGGMLQLFFGSVFHYRTSALICATANLVSFALFFTVPESPVWLIMKGRTGEAQRALAWFRGFLEPQHVQEEFQELVRYSKLSTALSCKNIDGILEEKIPLDGEKEQAQAPKETMVVATKNWLKERVKILTNPKLYLPLRMVLVVFFITQCAGIGPVRNYIVEILKQFWFPVDSKGVLVMTGAMSFLGGIASIFLIKLTGKRVLCLVCLIISTISIFGFGLYTSFLADSRDVILGWLFIVNLAVIHFVGSIGVLNIPWILIYEVYPLKGRGIACGISAGASSLMSFLMTKTFYQAEHMVGLSGLFYFYGAVSFAGCIYVYLCVPETEGKTLEQIETYFTPYHDRKEKFRMPPKKSSRAVP